MNRPSVVTVLSEHRRSLMSLAVTVMLLGSLAAAAMPSSALETGLTGPDEVDRNDRITVTATVDIKDGERVPIETYVFTISPEDADGELSVTFAPNGTVLEVTPERGTINRGDIRINQFVKTLTITPVGSSASYDYGSRTAFDENAGVTRDYGYGYGYGYGEQPEFEYEISFRATALDRGTFVGQLGIGTSDETSFESDEFQFDVTRPTKDAEDGAASDGVDEHDDAEDTDRPSRGDQNRRSDTRATGSDTSQGRSAVTVPTFVTSSEGGLIR
ncbi:MULTISPECIES: hypothetical protein [Haloferax]|uniref:Uncharacterized protein n=2 Tax=Haloferax TaxID=2251 RepID=A0A6G1Z6P6_9EURY|nr:MULTISPECIES: hypothetical protein [Haloferax]KAB1185425.1 hypothetical protein Hfx1149_15335 [Haloferax sp. CBA1149]MRW82071.1 hypothetical protein [Haloferax marinisediminis]